jgi:methionine-gamma-lyase
MLISDMFVINQNKVCIVSNPLLEVDIAGLSKHNLKLVVDNISPLSVSPVKFGADIVIHSLTKYINGSSDTGGVTCISRFHQ